MFEKPNCIHSEQSVLGGLILSGLRDANCLTAFDKLVEDDFYEGINRKIFTAIKQLHNDGSPIEAASVASKVQGSNEYIVTLLDSTPGWSTIGFYTDEVKKKSIERRYINAMQESISVLSSQQPHEVKLDTINRLIADVDGHITDKKDVWIKDLIEPILNEIDELLNTDKVAGIPTGYTDLDRKIGGFEPGMLITLGARTSVGKSTIAMNIAENIASKGYKCRYITMEMSPRELTRRVLRSQGRLSGTLFKNPKQATQDDFNRFNIGASKAMDMDISMIEIPSPTIDDILQDARSFNRKYGLDFLIVDHLHLMSHKGLDAVNAIADTTKRLKGLAVELNIPILLLAQLNRGSAKENRFPVITDLRGSGAIEQDSNMILLLHRDDEELPNQAVLYVAKNRDGESNVGITLASNLEYSRFDNAVYNQEIY